MTTTESIPTDEDLAGLESTRSAGEVTPWESCHHVCEHLELPQDDPTAAAAWHDRFCETLANLDLAAVCWVLDEIATSDEMVNSAGVMPESLGRFVAEHNWPDPVFTARFASLVEGFYEQAAKLVRLRTVCRSAGIDVDAAERARCVIRGGGQVSEHRASTSWSRG